MKAFRTEASPTHGSIPLELRAPPTMFRPAGPACKRCPPLPSRPLFRSLGGPAILCRLCCFTGHPEGQETPYAFVCICVVPPKLLVLLVCVCVCCRGGACASILMRTFFAATDSFMRHITNINCRFTDARPPRRRPPPPIPCACTT